MTTLSPQDIRTLEQTRQRLAQLTKSLSSLQQQILSSDPLPPWPTLHSLSQVILQNLSSVTAHLNAASPLLSRLAVFPMPSYPGREQEPLLGQYLRKKLEPRVEDWVEEGRVAGEQIPNREAFAELWEWAGQAANEQARRHEWGGEYTLAEIEMGIENVDTGLKGDESEDDEDEDGDAKMNEGDDTGEKMKALPMDDVLRFLVKGVEPTEKEDKKK